MTRGVVTNPLLTAIDLRKSFGGVKAVDGVSFDLAPGNVLAVIGPNGAGKSTVFNMVGGQITPDLGDIILNGQSITGLPARTICKRGVGRTFQMASTFMSMTCLENTLLAVASQRGRLFDLVGRFNRKDKEAAMALLEQVGMADQAELACDTLSYADLKKLELAMALAGGPILLLMDEPTAGMAPKERHSLMALATKIARDANLAVLFTEHDMDAVFQYADKILVMHNGQRLAFASPLEIANDKEVQRVYFGSQSPKKKRAKARQNGQRKESEKEPS